MKSQNQAVKWTGREYYLIPFLLLHLHSVQCQVLPAFLPCLPFQSTFHAALRLFPVSAVSVSLPCLECAYFSHQRHAFPCIPFSSLAGFCLSLQFSTCQDPLSNEAKRLLFLSATRFHSACVLCLKYSLSSTSLSGTFSRPGSELHLLDSVSCFYNSYGSFLLILSLNIHWMHQNVCSS